MQAFPGSGRRNCRRVARLAVATLLLWTALPAAGATDAELEARLAAGDAAWSRRAAGCSGLRADPEPITTAVAEYERALALAPDSIATRAKLLRALFYLGRYASPAGERPEVYRRGREQAEAGLARLDPAGLDLQRPAKTAAALAGRPEAAALFFWAAAHWGLWGEQSGALAAARRGVAARVRERAEVAVALDPGYEAAGALRILGRLHTEAPRIPLVTGWVERAVAVESLERAASLAPEEPLNRVYLADALLRFRPARRGEAVALLREVVAGPPRPERLLEDEETLALARELLEQATAPRRDCAAQVKRNSITSPSATG